MASFFVSRVDGKVDPMLDARSGLCRRSLRGTIAIANAAAAYAGVQQTLDRPRWDALAARGAKLQRPLWASTSTKDPRYPDMYYVEALIGPAPSTPFPRDLRGLPRAWPALPAPR